MPVDPSPLSAMVGALARGLVKPDVLGRCHIGDRGAANQALLIIRDPTIICGAKPYGPFFNRQWVDTANKNVKAVSALLGEHRLAMHQPLLQEARRLWQLVRLGESEMGQWD